MDRIVHIFRRAYAITTQLVVIFIRNHYSRQLTIQSLQAPPTNLEGEEVSTKLFGFSQSQSLHG